MNKYLNFLSFFIFGIFFTTSISAMEKNISFSSQDLDPSSSPPPSQPPTGDDEPSTPLSNEEVSTSSTHPVSQDLSSNSNLSDPENTSVVKGVSPEIYHQFLQTLRLFKPLLNRKQLNDAVEFLLGNEPDDVVTPTKPPAAGTSYQVNDGFYKLSPDSKHTKNAVYNHTYVSDYDEQYKNFKIPKEYRIDFSEWKIDNNPVNEDNFYHALLQVEINLLKLLKDHPEIVTRIAYVGHCEGKLAKRTTTHINELGKSDKQFTSKSQCINRHLKEGKTLVVSSIIKNCENKIFRMRFEALIINTFFTLSAGNGAGTGPDAARYLIKYYEWAERNKTLAKHGLNNVAEDYRKKLEESKKNIFRKKRSNSAKNLFDSKKRKLSADKPTSSSQPSINLTLQGSNNNLPPRNDNDNNEDN